MPVLVEVSANGSLDIAVPVCSGGDGIASLDISMEESAVEARAAGSATGERMVALTLNGETLSEGTFNAAEVSAITPLDTSFSESDVVAVFVSTQRGFAEFDTRDLRTGRLLLIEGRSTPRPSMLSSAEVLDQWCK